MKIKAQYVVDDKSFDSLAEAEDYVREVEAKREERVVAFWASYSGQRLQKELAAAQVDFGTFVIKDEGQVDFGVYGRSPLVLANVRGQIDDVLRYAISLPGFWGYGPGQIELINIIDV